MNTPLVSAIMTAYNAEAFIAEAIDSVLSQTYTNIELLVLNDASTDRTEAIVLEKQRKDARIKYYKNEVNEGISRTKNRIIPLAQGEYIAITDADDVNMPKRFEKQVKVLMEHPGTHIVGASMKLVNNRNRVCEVLKYPTSNEEIKKGLATASMIANPVAMFRREVFYKLNGYDVNLVICEDWDFFYRAAGHFNFYNIPEPLVYYRIHASNTSVSKLEETVIYAVYLRNGLPMRQSETALNDLVKNHPQYKGDVCRDINRFYSFSMHVFLKLAYPKLSYGLYKIVTDRFFSFFDRGDKRLFIRNAIAVYVKNGYYVKALPLLKDYFFFK